MSEVSLWKIFDLRFLIREIIKSQFVIPSFGKWCNKSPECFAEMVESNLTQTGYFQTA